MLVKVSAKGLITLPKQIRGEFGIDKIANNDVESGFLEVESYVKVDSIFTIEKKMVAKVVAKLKVEKIDDVRMKLAELFEV